MNNKETEALISNQWVGSSNLSGNTIVFKGLAVMRWAFCVSGVPSGFQVFVGTMSSSSGCSSLYKPVLTVWVGAVDGSWMYAHSRS